MSFVSEVTADSPYVWWKLDAGSGTAFADSGSASLAGTLQSTTSVTYPSSLVLTDPTPPCLDLHAVSGNSVKSGTIASYGGASATFEAIVRPRALPTAGSIYGIASIGQIAAGGDHVGIRIGDAGFRAGQLAGYVNAGHEISTSSGNDLVAGNTYHVVFTYDATTGIETLYINGSSVATATITAAVVQSTSGDNMYAGNDLSNTGRTFDGAIQHIAVYRTALSSTRVLAHYNATQPTTLTNTSPAFARAARGFSMTVTKLTTKAVVPAFARAARGFSATITKLVTKQVTPTTTRTRGFSMTVLPIRPTSLAATRSPRGFSLTLKSVMQVTLWTADVSQSWARKRGFQ